MIAANEHLHGLLAHLLPYLMNIAFSDQISTGDQHDAIGDAVYFV